jgi:nucleoid-associated protein YgaU
MALEKALITKVRPDDGTRVPGMFNPEEYTLSQDVNYAKIGVPGLPSPVLQFVSGNVQTLAMELFLDTYEAHRQGSRVLNEAGEDVRRLSNTITQFLWDRTLHAPPVLLFTWSSLSFTCVLASVSQRFTMFLPTGTPVRARLQVTFNEFRDPAVMAMELKNETADYTKLHVVTEGDTLSGIAARLYDDPALWRPIALVNAIDDPRDLAVGRRLVIPRLPFRDPETGEVTA